jgi:putative hydrolase of the HAD superfamily
MTLLLMDLDNTLIDRDAAFRSAVAEFLADNDLPAGDLEWVMSVDASGFAARDLVAASLTARYGDVPVRPLLDTGAADRVVLEPSVRDALSAARDQGWTLVIVSDGRTAQQEAKIHRTGLDRLVDGWVVSEAAGHRKPEPGIFHAAASLVGRPLDGAWMIGDSAHADIGGAAALGLRSVWISNGRPWNHPGPEPTAVEPDAVSAIRRVVTRL